MALRSFDLNAQTRVRVISDCQQTGYGTSCLLQWLGWGWGRLLWRDQERLGPTVPDPRQPDFKRRFTDFKRQLTEPDLAGREMGKRLSDA